MKTKPLMVPTNTWKNTFSGASHASHKRTQIFTNQMQQSKSSPSETPFEVTLAGKLKLDTLI